MRVAGSNDPGYAFHNSLIDNSQEKFEAVDLANDADQKRNNKARMSNEEKMTKLK